MIFTHLARHGLRDYQSFDRVHHGDGYNMKTHACKVDPKDPSRYRGLCGVKVVVGRDNDTESMTSQVWAAEATSRPTCKRCRGIIEKKQSKTSKLTKSPAPSLYDLKRTASRFDGRVLADGMGGFEIIAPPDRKWINADVQCIVLTLNEIDPEQHASEIQRCLDGIAAGHTAFVEIGGTK